MVVTGDPLRTSGYTFSANGEPWLSDEQAYPFAGAMERIAGGAAPHLTGYGMARAAYSGLMPEDAITSPQRARSATICALN